MISSHFRYRDGCYGYYSVCELDIMCKTVVIVLCYLLIFLFFYGYRGVVFRGVAVSWYRVMGSVRGGRPILAYAIITRSRSNLANLAHWLSYLPVPHVRLRLSLPYLLGALCGPQHPVKWAPFAALAQAYQKRPFVERFIVATDARIIWVFQAN
jgi:hypothetical protein